MAHTSEKRWQRNQTSASGDGLSNQVTDLAAQMLDVLYKAEKLGLELEELIDYVGSDSKSAARAVADQVFYEVWSARESDPLGNPGIFDEGANEDECVKVADAIAAVNAAREIFDFANDSSEGKSRISKLRRMG